MSSSSGGRRSRCFFTGSSLQIYIHRLGAIYDTIRYLSTALLARQRRWRCATLAAWVKYEAQAVPAKTKAASEEAYDADCRFPMRRWNSPVRRFPRDCWRPKDRRLKIKPFKLGDDFEVAMGGSG